MPRNDREVFDAITTGDSPAHIDLLTYALFAAEKKEWMLHFGSANDRPPEQAEIDGWIANVSEYQFTRMRAAALDFFVESAENYLQERIAQHKEDILNTAVVAQVRAASSWWKQLALSLLAAIVAPLILGLVLVAINAYSGLFTHNDVAKKVLPPSTSQQPPTPPATQ